MAFDTQSPPTAAGTPTRTIGSGPVEPSSDSVKRRPVKLGAVRLTEGIIGDLQRSNGATSIREGDEHLRTERAWENFADAASGRTGEYFGPVFEDGEVYKWLEAVAWEFARSGDVDLGAWLERYTALIASAQNDDGYLNTFFDVSGQRTERYERLDFDHEIFNMGAMIQAAVAQYRASGREEFLTVARRAADHLDETFGPDKVRGTCGHPVTEMALVELYRTTEEPRYLALAKFFVEVRGSGQLSNDHFGPSYFSDRIPVRETLVPEGHAVRAVYLASGATDVAIETGDRQLLAVLERQWHNMVEQKMYVTGALGARWEGEAFGDPYELPSDRAYAETCAAIASMQWSWRLFLATGDAKYHDLIERQFYNAVLSGVSIERDAYFYVNALQVREGAVIDNERNPAYGRQHWFGCSCCPTNLMRTVASVHHYLASRSADAIQLNQYSSAIVEAAGWELEIETAYPWHGRVQITVKAAPTNGQAIELRIPAWADGAEVSVNGITSSVSPGSYYRVEGPHRSGEVIELTLPTIPRLTKGNPRIDGIRGSVAIERGPIVYAIEQVDQPVGVHVDDVAIVDGDLGSEFREDLLGGVPVVTFSGATTQSRVGYSMRASSVPHEKAPAVTTAAADTEVKPVGILQAIPYFLWANRELGPMKVWLPDRAS